MICLQQKQIRKREACSFVKDILVISGPQLTLEPKDGS